MTFKLIIEFIIYLCQLEKINTYQEKADILKSHPKKQMNRIEHRLFVGVISEIFFACIDCCVACIDTIIFNITQAMGQPFAVKQT